ncbi:hypothetical protein M9194_13335 [Vibrio sp. S4M6]|uniref:hypothetical protein n=1 Tax=Vibrio sinus TaxID=2946865 RepID=UPI00202A276D|nr:hypothetical protein [Vibrio sinus]MCL9782411.1 hypothetical protein [Vibrio sinus]
MYYLTRCLIPFIAAFLPVLSAANSKVEPQTQCIAKVQEQCKLEAMTAYSALKMIQQGTVPGTKHQVDYLKKAISQIEKGNYCLAKSIVVNLPNT